MMGDLPIIQLKKINSFIIKILNMPTTTFKGIVQSVTMETYGEDNTGKRQNIVVLVPGYTDAYGDKKGADEIYEVNQFNEGITKNVITEEDVNRKIDLELYLKGRAFDKKDGTGKAYIIGLSVKSMKLGDKIKVEEKEDDLPF